MSLLSGKKILVTGAGGRSGLAAAKLYLRLGAQVILSDRNQSDLPSELLVAAVSDLRPREDGGLLTEFSPDWIVTAPGVPLSSPIFQTAKEKGIPVYGEHDYAFHLLGLLQKNRPFVIGVTGTDGKSTTVELIRSLLQNTFSSVHPILCGNFGYPLSDIADTELKENTILIAEMSSYQLEPLQFFAPHISAILNLAEDHLDRYDGIEAYLEAKLNIIKKQGADDLFFAPDWIVKKAIGFEKREGTGPVRKIALDLPGEGLKLVNDEIHFASRRLLARDEFPLQGEHNLTNLDVALRVLHEYARRLGLSIDDTKLIAAIRSLKGLPHRMEVLGKKQGILFVNDSKATTVQSVQSAIRSYQGRRVHLLIGGRQKGADYTILAGAPGVEYYPYGESGEMIGKALGKTVHYKNLKEAFETALSKCRSDADPVLLLSPGCSSFDEFRSFENRGEYFRTLYEELEE